jgi:hypothetical protein
MWNTVQSPPASEPTEQLVAQRTQPERNLHSLALTRRQRLIYLLVDGQRTVADIMRTANKSALEIELLLSELQELGLVRL